MHPSVVGAVVRHLADAVEHRVAEPHVVGLHVDLGAKYLLAVVEHAVAHLPEQVEVLVDRTIAMRALDAGLAEAAPLRRDGLLVLVVDVGEALADQLLGPLVDLLEVVGREARRPGRRDAEPGEVLLDRIDVRHVLGLGVRVVEAEEAGAAELLGDPEVEVDRLRVTDVEEAVGLRREPGLHPAAVLSGLDVGLDLLPDEVERRCCFRCVGHGVEARGPRERAVSPRRARGLQRPRRAPGSASTRSRARGRPQQRPSAGRHRRRGPRGARPC